MSGGPSILSALCILSIAVLVLPMRVPAQTEEPPNTVPELPELPTETSETKSSFEDKLTGDWGGARSDLADHGVNFTFDFTAEAITNTSGGRRRGTAIDGLLVSAVDLNLEKLAGWKGGEFYINSLWFHGKSLSSNFTGDLLGVSNIDEYDTLRLYELWLQQKFLDDILSLKAGQLAADRDFASSDYGSLFVNATFGMPAAIWLDSPAVTYYIATTGVRLRADPIEQFYVETGCYDGNPDPTAGSGVDPSNLNSTGTRISLNNGAFIMFEAGYKLNQGAKATGLPGTYKLGGWMHTHTFADEYDQTLNNNNSALAPTDIVLHRGDHGLYAMADQMVYQEAANSEQGLGLFARVAGSPPNTNLISFYVDGGLNYIGLIPTREKDIFGIAFAYAAISPDIRRANRDMNDIGEGPFAIPDHESVLEVTYSAAITPWCTLQPDFQWVMHPGGSRQLADAIVVGIRTTISF